MAVPDNVDVGPDAALVVLVAGTGTMTTVLVTVAVVVGFVTVFEVVLRVVVGFAGTAVEVLLAEEVAAAPVSEEPGAAAPPFRSPTVLGLHVVPAVVHPVRRLATSET